MARLPQIRQSWKSVCAHNRRICHPERAPWPLHRSLRSAHHNAQRWAAQFMIYAGFSLMVCTANPVITDIVGSVFRITWPTKLRWRQCDNSGSNYTAHLLFGWCPVSLASRTAHSLSITRWPPSPLTCHFELIGLMWTSHCAGRRLSQIHPLQSDSSPEPL